MLLSEDSRRFGPGEHLRFLIPLRPAIATVIVAATSLFFLRRSYEIPPFGGW